MLYPHEILTQETLQELRVIHAAYKEKALESEDTLDWNGPLLYPECVADLARANDALRLPIKSLLLGPSPCRPAPTGQSSSTWQLELRSPLAVGKYNERGSQVWKCDVLEGWKRGVKARIVLKLYFKGFVPYFNIAENHRNECWMDEEEAVKNEARAYERFKPIQGSQVPFCYGVYNFKLPGRFEVKGMVLEDLSGSMHSVQKEWNVTKPQESGQIPYEKWIDNLLQGICYALHFIHKHKIYTGTKNIFPKDTSIPRDPTTASGARFSRVTFVGFASSYALDEWAGPDGSLTIRGGDCHAMIQSVFATLQDAIVYRWQHYMRAKRRTVFENPGILFDDPEEENYFPHHDGEFDWCHQDNSSGGDVTMDESECDLNEEGGKECSKISS